MNDAPRPWWISPAALSGRLVLRLLAALTRKRLPPRDGQGDVAGLRHGEPTILVLWHDETFLAASFLRLLTRSHRIAILASHSNDGELVTQLAEPLGVFVTRGSASRGGSAGLRALYRAVTKNGASPLLMPDGPRGPQYVVKPGAVVLAQMTGAPILPLHFRARAVLRLRSWDRMAVPLPFATVQLHIGEAIEVPRQLGDEQIRELQAEVQRRLEALRDPKRSPHST